MHNEEHVCETDPGVWTLTSASFNYALCIMHYAFVLFFTRVAYRAISTARLNVSPRLHLRPINVVVFDGPFGETLSWSRLRA